MLPLMILFLPSTLLTLGVTELMVAVLPAFASVIALTAIELMALDTLVLVLHYSLATLHNSFSLTICWLQVI
jgi:hypothetical protein